MSPKAGGGDLSQWIQLYTGAQTNFGDLTPYLNYDHYIKKVLAYPKESAMGGGKTSNTHRNAADFSNI